MGITSQVDLHIPRAVTIIVVLLPKQVKVCFIVTYVNKLSQKMIITSPLSLKIKEVIQIKTNTWENKATIPLKITSKFLQICNSQFYVNILNQSTKLRRACQYSMIKLNIFHSHVWVKLSRPDEASMSWVITGWRKGLFQFSAKPEKKPLKITWINYEFLSIRLSETTFSEIWIKMHCLFF